MIHSCGNEVPDGSIYCGFCATAIVDRPPAPATVPIAAPPAADPVACPVCGRSSPVVPRTCDFCGTEVEAPAAEPAPAADGTLRVTLPDGSAVALDDPFPLELGRESPRPEVSAALAEYDAVSRRHARLTATAGGVAVEDLGSTNGTSLDGRRLTPGEVVVAQPPFELRFGSSVVVRVQ